MHYYQFHIGDYRRDTIHLSRIEHSIYRDLIDWYFLDEKPIPADIDLAIRKLRLVTEEEKTSLVLILKDFFSLTEEGWRHSRIDEQIKDYHEKCEKNRLNGKSGGRPKKNPVGFQSVTNGLPVGCDSEPNRNPIVTLTNNHKPITNNQLNKEAKASLSAKCPTEQIIDLYHEILPEMPSIRLVTEKRKKAIRSFWQFVLTSKRSDGTPRAENEDQAIDWIKAYFDRARKNDFLMGKKGRVGEHSNWQCDLDYLLTEKGRIQVIEKTAEES